jgi:KUP system potassium uptake protein
MSQSVRFYGAIHERNILLTFVSADAPHLTPEERVTVEELIPGIIRVLARYGFMEQPNMIAALKMADSLGVEYRPHETVFIAGRDAVNVTSNRGMPIWRKRLFAYMSRNSQMAPIHFGVPVHKLIEIGSQTTL